MIPPEGKGLDDYYQVECLCPGSPLACPRHGEVARMLQPPAAAAVPDRAAPTEGRCPGCGNRYDGDNFCMPSACEQEGMPAAPTEGAGEPDAESHKAEVEIVQRALDRVAAERDALRDTVRTLRADLDATEERLATEARAAMRLTATVARIEAVAAKADMYVQADAIRTLLADLRAALVPPSPGEPQ